MKHAFLISSWCIFLLSFHGTRGIAQSCVPNNDTVSGISPDTLAIAYVGIPYNEVIYFHLPFDTVIPFIIGQDTLLLPVCLDSITIDSVHGLPEGFSYGCNVPWCAVPGGGNGCASLSGTAQGTGIFPLEVFVTAYANDCFGFSLPAAVDTVTFYFIDVQEPAAIQELSPGSMFYMGRCFPNPAGKEVSIPYYLPATGDVLISVLSPEGKIVMEKSFAGRQGYHAEPLDISALPGNSYLVQVESGGRYLYGKFMKQ